MPSNAFIRRRQPSSVVFLLSPPSFAHHPVEMGRILPGVFKQRPSNPGTLPRKAVTIGADLLMASSVKPDPKVGTVIAFVTASDSNPSSPASGAPPDPDSSQLPIRSGGGAETANFTFHPRRPSQPFEFSSSSSPSQGSTSSKRERPLTDVDGPGTSHAQKKKRRLRLGLVTSRLSSPYATPTTYAPDRGSSKIAVWARQKKTPRDVSIVRKAAILNRMQRRAMKGYERHWQALQRLGQDDGEEYDDEERLGEAPEVGNAGDPNGPRVESPNRNYHVDPPSPRHCPAVPLPYHQPAVQQSFIGISNYDALDDDDLGEYEDHRHEEEDDQGEGVPGPSSRPAIDFNNISTDDGSVVDDADFIESFGAFGPGPFDFGKHRGTTESGSPTRRAIPEHQAGPGIDPADAGDRVHQSSIPPLSLENKDRGKRRQEDPGSPEEDLVGKLIDLVGESERQRDRKGSLRSK